jgi:long-chain acyl-CoA synthetase
MYICGGVNVYPAEVEAVLAEVDGVADVAVFALADEQWGQRVCAAVVPGAQADPEKLVASVRARAADQLAGYKRPKQIEFVDELPRTATGKVQRLALPELLGLT